MKIFIKTVCLGLVLAASPATMATSVQFSPKQQLKAIKSKIESMVDKKKQKKAQSLYESYKAKLAELNKQYHILPTVAVLTTAAFIAFLVRYLMHDTAIPAQAPAGTTDQEKTTQQAAKTDFTITIGEQKASGSAPVQTPDRAAEQITINVKKPQPTSTANQSNIQPIETRKANSEPTTSVSEDLTSIGISGPDNPIAQLH